MISVLMSRPETTDRHAGLETRRPVLEALVDGFTPQIRQIAGPGTRIVQLDGRPLKRFKYPTPSRTISFGSRAS